MDSCQNNTLEGLTDNDKASEMDTNNYYGNCIFKKIVIFIIFINKIIIIIFRWIMHDRARKYSDSVRIFNTCMLGR